MYRLFLTFLKIGRIVKTICAAPDISTLFYVIVTGCNLDRLQFYYRIIEISYIGNQNNNDDIIITYQNIIMRIN